MTNLSWLVAALRPRDIAPHPNFGELGENNPPALLAALLLNEVGGLNQRRQSQNLSDIYANRDSEFGLVSQTLSAETIEQGLSRLITTLMAAPPTDLARDAALTLFACCAAAELDDYSAALNLLAYEIRFSDQRRNEDEKFVQLVLQQQLALRLRDAGEPYIEHAKTVLELHAQLNIEQCTPFETSRGVSWGYDETLKAIAQAIWSAAQQMISTDNETAPEIDSSELAPWQVLLRAAPAVQLLRIETMRENEYCEFVSQIFVQRLQGIGTWTLGGPARPDLYYSTLMLELLGHPSVYGARKEMAQLRFVQAASPQERLRLTEALRLLRHAEAEKELDLALNWLRTTGPLAVLSSDARQILRRRLTRPLMRVVELRVLTEASELLTPLESTVALDAVLFSISEGGPLPPRHGWQSDVVRLEAAWIAAAALAHRADRQDDVARLLLDQVAVVVDEPLNQLLDRAIARSLERISWTGVSDELCQQWMTWFSTGRTQWQHSSEIVARGLEDRVQRAAVSPTDLVEVANIINDGIAGREITPEHLQQAMAIVQAKLSSIREAAAIGSHSWGGYSVADLAAGLIIYCGGTDLWHSLTEFLVDPQVAREDKSSALERLARDASELPGAISDVFRENAKKLLDTPPQLFEAGIIPYPSALRLFSAHAIINEQDSLYLTSKLAGSSTTIERREAAQTLALLTQRKDFFWIEILALQLSFDDDVNVRAYAGRTLASPRILDVRASFRVVELLREEGLLIPLFVLRELKRDVSTLGEEIRRQIIELSRNHPSSMVRTEAASFYPSADADWRRET